MTLEQEVSALSERLRTHANARSKALTGFGPTQTQCELRDTSADALAELAEAVRQIAAHLCL